MSEQDKIIAAGINTLARSEAKRQYAMLKGTVAPAADGLLMLGKMLRPGVTENFTGSLQILTELINAGGFESIKNNVEKCIALAARIAELEKTADDSGY